MYILIITDNINNPLKLKQSFEDTSEVTFTYEIGIHHHTTFLDIHVHTTESNILCSVCQNLSNSALSFSVNGIKTSKRSMQ